MIAACCATSRFQSMASDDKPADEASLPSGLGWQSAAFATLGVAGASTTVGVMPHVFDASQCAPGYVNAHSASEVTRG